MHEDFETKQIHLLGLSETKLNSDVTSLSKQKAEFAHVAGHMSHDKHAHPLVALTDGKKVVEYNMKATVPAEWIIDPATGNPDKTRLPEKIFETPYRKNGQIDWDKWEQLAAAASLDEQARTREALLHSAHDIAENATLVAASERFALLRNKDGRLQPGADKYELPPLERGHVSVPKPAAAPASHI